MWTFLYYANSFILGVVFCLSMQVFVVWRFIQKKKSKSSSESVVMEQQQQKQQQKKLNQKRYSCEDEDGNFVHKHKNWPPSITQFMQDNLSQSSPQPADIKTSLNVIIHRFFIEAQNSPILEAKLKSKLMEKIGGGGNILQSAQVDDISLGEYPPLVNNVSIMASESLDVLFQCELEYNGGFHVKITTLLTMGIRIPVTVRLGRLKGNLQIRFPSPVDSSQYAIAFTSEPDLELVVESSLWRRDNEMFRDVLNALIAKRLRNSFLDSWVLPNWRPFSMPMITIREPDIAMLRLLNPEEYLLLSNRTTWKSGNRVVSTSLPSANNNNNNATSSAPSSVPPSSSSSAVDLSQQIPHPHNSSAVESPRSPGIFTGKLFDFQNQSSATVDVLESKCFPVGSVVNQTNVKEYGSMLVGQFIKLASEEQQKTNFADAWSSSEWEVWRVKKSIQILRKFVFMAKERSEVFKAVFDIKCSPEKTFQILSNPEHLRHTDDIYIDSTLIADITEGYRIRKFHYKYGRSEKHLTALEIKTSISSSKVVAGIQMDKDAWMVVYRTAASGKQTNETNKLSNEPTVFINGYMITRCEAGSRVVIVSQFDQSIASKLNPTIQKCQRIRAFVEELSQWTDINGKEATPQSASGSSSTNISPLPANEGRERIKSVSSTSTQVLRAGRAFTSSSSINVTTTPAEGITNRRSRDPSIVGGESVLSIRTSRSEMTSRPSVTEDADMISRSFDGRLLKNNSRTFESVDEQK